MVLHAVFPSLLFFLSLSLSISLSYSLSLSLSHTLSPSSLNLPLIPSRLRTGGASGRGPASPSRVSSRQSTTPKASPFRYTPEQLLKLFNPSGTGRAPQTLRETPGIYSPQPQIPMSLKEMTEREKVRIKRKKEKNLSLSLSLSPPSSDFHSMGV